MKPVSTFSFSAGVTFSVILALAACPETHAQGSRADYERAAGLRSATTNKVFRDRVEAHWLPGGSSFWYEVKTGPDSREFVFVDAEKGERRPAFDHARLAQALNGEGVAEARPDRLALRALEWPEGNTFHFTTAGKRWSIALDNYAVLEQKPVAAPPIRGIEPANAPTASRRTGAETALTFINRSNGSVELFWLDPEGARRSYGRISAGQSSTLHTFEGHVWLVTNAEGKTLATYEATETAGEAEITGVTPASTPATNRSTSNPSPLREASSPDGKWQAAIKDHNVVLRDRVTKEEFALTSDGSADHSYRSQFFWSPDSKKVVALHMEKGEEHKVSFVDSSPKDQVQPKLVTFDYLKPGDKLPHTRPALFEVATRRRIPVSDALFPNPWTTNGSMAIRWERDSSRFTFVYNQRGHQVLRVIGVDAATGAARALVDEQSETFIHYSGKMFLEWIDNTGELIWMSERDGWNHLYLYDAKQGRVKNPITRGDWVVRGVDRVDREWRQIWFRAGGIVPGRDPYYVHHCRVNFDGSGLVVLTEGDGTHTVEFSPDRRFIVDTYSRVDLAPVIELRRATDGKLVCELERAHAGALQPTGLLAPEQFVAKARDGVTDIYGIIVRPSNFDPAKKYPVIESIYAGPHDAFVPKAFSALPRVQELAELGFVVVQIDGLGTSQRSKKFHDFCWKNIVDAGLPDRVLWIKAAAQKYPALDVTRVGIYGTSAGGQSALGALLTHGDFYRAGVSDCGCHDNRMDKIWWNEQWMGWPVGPHYDAQSNVTLAPNLQGKLLLMVGEMDRNVDPASTTQVVNALIKANKDFEFLVVPGAGHGVAGTPYGKRRLQDFFVRHLLGREPRWQ